MSLAGKTVLVTRPRHQAGEVVEEIERRGAKAIVIPIIQILPPESWEACDEALHALSSYDALLFTSANAVESFLDRTEFLGINSQTDFPKSVLAVGARTREALVLRGVRVMFVPPEQSGHGLVTAMPPGKIQGRRFLHPRGDRAREEVAEGLKERGGQVALVTVYRTAAPDPGAAEMLRRTLSAGQVDVVTFFSPSAVDELLNLLDEGTRAQLGKRVLTAVIGPTTGAALADQGIPVTMTAPEPTGGAIVAAIERYFTV